MLQRAPSFRELGSSDLAHVPTFFPAVPDQHTLKCSPACDVVDKMREVSFLSMKERYHRRLTLSCQVHCRGKTQ